MIYSLLLILQEASMKTVLTLRINQRKVKNTKMILMLNQEVEELKNPRVTERKKKINIK